MAHPRRIICSFEENQISGLCFSFGNVLAFLPQSVGCGASDVITSLIVDPADIAGAVKTGVRRASAPYIGHTYIFLGLGIDFGKLLIRQGFRGNGIVDASFTGAIRTACRQATIMGGNYYGKTQGKQE